MRGLLTICARGGSKGIPDKNIKIINGKPLIAYSIEVAILIGKQLNIDIILSTDSTAIKKSVRDLNFDKLELDYNRPEYLASDTAGKLDAIKDAKIYMESKNQCSYDYLIDLDVTSPLRNDIDVMRAYELLFDNESALNIFSVSPANRNPYFNMVEENKDGFYELCKVGEFLTRQSAPKVYDLNASYYIYKASFFQQEFKTVITNRTLVYEVPHICFDLDHPIDFEFMSFLMENKKLNFDFAY